MYINPKIKFKNKNNTSDAEKLHFFCHLCKFPLISFDDFNCAKEWNGVCHECYLTFVEARRKEWKENWRPDKETLEEYIYKRKSVLLQQEKK